MKTPIIYIRIAKDKKGQYKVDASLKPNPRTLMKKVTYAYKNDEPLPTIQIAVRANLPEDAFAISERMVQDINIEQTQLKSNIEVVNQSNPN